MDEIEDLKMRGFLIEIGFLVERGFLLRIGKLSQGFLFLLTFPKPNLPQFQPQRRNPKHF